MDKEKKYSTFLLLKVINEYIRPYRRQFWWGTLSRTIDVTLGLYTGIALGTIVNALAGSMEHGKNYVFWVLGVWLLIACLRPPLQNFGKNTLFAIGEKAKADVQLRYLRALFAKESSWHESENAGNKVKRISNGADAINKIIREWCKTILEMFIGVAGMCIVVGFDDVRLSVALLIFMAIYISISIALLRPAAHAAVLVNHADEAVDGVFFESVNNIRTVKTLNLAEELLKRAKLAVVERFQKVRERIKKFQFRSSALQLFAGIFRIACLTIIALGVIHGKYQVGFFALFYTYFNTLWIKAEHMADASQEITVAKQQIFRMRESFEGVPLLRQEETKYFPKDWKTITVKDVSFSYTDETVLKRISFEVKRGEKIGIIGLSGAGKSTLFKLLLKERNHTEGTILVEGVSINEIKEEDYLAHVSVVLQDTEVFNMSLRDNVTIVRPELEKSESLLDRALTVSHVKDFLPKLRDGVETIIGEKGVKLSGGERQRLGIARAIYKDPDILLMDEATSHLDIESEKKIQASLHEFFQGVTAIVIAHRLTTIKEMNKILVIEEGRIIEQGTFDELYKKKGRFFELWEKQQL